MLIKMAVQDTPTLLGTKLKQSYFMGPNYFEIDVEVGSSSVARNIVGLMIGSSTSLCIDIGMCLQGNDTEELPEELMCACTCKYLDTTTAKKL
jgi:hypothetical protein